MLEYFGYISVVGIVSGMVIMSHSFFKNSDIGISDFKDSIFILSSVLILGLGALVGFVCTILLTMTLGSCLPEIITVHETPIVSLVNNSEISGSFILGSGSINESEYYIFFEKVGYNGYKRGKTPAYKTLIVEDDSKEPMLKQTIVCREYNKFLGKIATTEFCKNTGLKLIVPTNTVVKEFNIK